MEGLLQGNTEGARVNLRYDAEFYFFNLEECRKSAPWCRNM